MKLSYTILYVQDVQQSIRFYQSAFGLELNFLHESGDYAEMKTGETTLAFCGHNLANQMVGRPYLKPSYEQPIASQLTFEPDDVKSAFEKVKNAGASVNSAPEIKPWNFEVAILQDPDGHLVELAKNLNEPYE